MTIKHKVFKKDELERTGWTKGELLKHMELDVTVDTALPQQWLDQFVKQTGLDYHLVLGTTFFAYSDELNLFGVPVSGCYEVNQRLFIREGIETELVTLFPIKYEIGQTITFTGNIGLNRKGKILSIWNNPEGIPYCYVKPVPYYQWENQLNYSLIVCLEPTYRKNSFGMIDE
jgi:hypothetical protein